MSFFAISSMALALRWRAVGRCASQQPMVQNQNFTRPLLHVDTEQRKILSPMESRLRHIEQTPKGSGGMRGTIAESA